MSILSEDEVCRTCRYWHCDPSHRDRVEGLGYKECHGAPPSSQGGVGAWPLVRADSWCGVWRALPKPKAEPTP